jgi:hypothetical protein
MMSCFKFFDQVCLDCVLEGNDNYLQMRLCLDLIFHCLSIGQLQIPNLVNNFVLRESLGSHCFIQSSCLNLINLKLSCFFHNFYQFWKD